MTAPPPQPDRYPNPDGANTQQYFDGTKWTDHIAPFNTSSVPGPLPPPKSQPKRPGPAKSLRPFVIIAIAGFVAFLETGFLMELGLAFSNAAGNVGSPIIGYQILAFVSFQGWLASIVATIVGIIGTIVGIIGTIVRSVRQNRSG